MEYLNGFRTVFRGFSREDVLAYVDRLSAELRSAEEERDRLQGMVDAAEARAAEAEAAVPKRLPELTQALAETRAEAELLRTREREMAEELAEAHKTIALLWEEKKQLLRERDAAEAWASAVRTLGTQMSDRLAACAMRAPDGEDETAEEIGRPAEPTEAPAAEKTAEKAAPAPVPESAPAVLPEPEPNSPVPAESAATPSVPAAPAVPSTPAMPAPPVAAPMAPVTMAYNPVPPMAVAYNPMPPMAVTYNPMTAPVPMTVAYNPLVSAPVAPTAPMVPSVTQEEAVASYWAAATLAGTPSQPAVSPTPAAPAESVPTAENPATAEPVAEERPSTEPDPAPAEPTDETPAETAASQEEAMASAVYSDSYWGAPTVAPATAEESVPAETDAENRPASVTRRRDTMADWLF